MNLPVRLRVAAEEDLAVHAAHIRENSLNAALRFLDAADASFSLIGAMPEIAGRCQFTSPTVPDMRVWPIRGFEKYLVFYHVLAEEIQVVRILHGARDLPELFGGD